MRKDKKSGCGMVGGAAWTKNWLTFDNSDWDINSNSKIEIIERFECHMI